MALTAILLVLVSSLLHAGWNLLCKAKAPSAAFFVLSTSSSIVLMTPLYAYFVPHLGRVPPVLWGILVVTGFCQALYYISLGNAYRLNDISVAYPIARALPVLLVPAVCAWLGLGGPLGARAIAGMVIVALGCLVLPLGTLNRTFWRRYAQASFLLILLTALCTTAYSIIDSQGLKLMKESEQALSSVQAALFYIAFENLAILGFLLMHLLFSRTEREQLRTLWHGARRYPLLSGPASTTAYVLVLFAMQLTPNVSYVVAFRQVSVLIGTILGVWLLRETLTRLKGLSLALVFIGLVLVALG